VKTKKLNLQGKIKKFPERAILLKMCANIRKYSRSGYFVKKNKKIKFTGKNNNAISTYRYQNNNAILTYRYKKLYKNAEL